MFRSTSRGLPRRGVAVRSALSLLGLGLLTPVHAALANTSNAPSAQNAVPPASQLREIQVTAAPSLSFDTPSVDGDHAGPQVTADSASLVRSMPGAALTYNGPLAGQVQYRGLFGPRNNVLINGMHIAPGGPNWMDPPLHYLPRPMLDTLTLQRGIAPVSDGIETEGATVRADSRQADFSDTGSTRLQGYGMAGYSSVDHGFTVGGMFGASGPSQRFDVLAARTHGDDAHSGDGRLRATQYTRNNAGADYGVRWVPTC